MASTGARTAGQQPAPVVVLEAPESLALLLYSTQHVGDREGIGNLRAALDAAAEVAARALHRHYPVAEVMAHDYAATDKTLPRPHVHITTRGRVDRSAFEGWARFAHARYQVELQQQLLGLGIGVTQDYPSPHGWEVTAAISQLGHISRQPCGPGLYPLDVEQVAAEARRSAS